MSNLSCQFRLKLAVNWLNFFAACLEIISNLILHFRLKYRIKHTKLGLVCHLDIYHLVMIILIIHHHLRSAHLQILLETIFYSFMGLILNRFGIVI